MKYSSYKAFNVTSINIIYISFKKCSEVTKKTLKQSNKLQK